MNAPLVHATTMMGACSGCAGVNAGGVAGGGAHRGAEARRHRVDVPCGRRTRTHPVPRYPLSCWPAREVRQSWSPNDKSVSRGGLVFVRGRPCRTHPPWTSTESSFRPRVWRAYPCGTQRGEAGSSMRDKTQAARSLRNRCGLPSGAQWSSRGAGCCRAAAAAFIPTLGVEEGMQYSATSQAIPPRSFEALSFTLAPKSNSSLPRPPYPPSPSLPCRTRSSAGPTPPLP